jgi:hypothetical protein
MTYFDELAQVLSRTDPAPLLDFVRGCEGTLWVAGNGGSADRAALGLRPVQSRGAARAGAGQQSGGADGLGE